MCLLVAWGRWRDECTRHHWWPGSCCATVEPCFATGATIWPGLPAPGTWSTSPGRGGRHRLLRTLCVIPGRVGMGVHATEGSTVVTGVKVSMVWVRRARQRGPRRSRRLAQPAAGATTGRLTSTRRGDISQERHPLIKWCRRRKSHSRQARCSSPRSQSAGHQPHCGETVGRGCECRFGPCRARPAPACHACPMPRIRGG